jgi:4a-hydroxytetrahydrobiopterin dehydratase
MAVQKLPPARVEAALDELAEWTFTDPAIARTYTFADFDASMAFVNAVAAEANAQNHHPDIAIAWNKVTISTWSHDAGGLTERDLRLARAVDALDEMSAPDDPY